MKRLILAVFAVLLVFTFSSTTLFAKTKVGVKGGVNLANLEIEAGIGGMEAQVEFDDKLGFCVGAFISYDISNMLALQPEVLFTMKGAQLLEEGFLGEGEFKSKMELNYVEIPVLAKVSIPAGSNIKLNAFAGPAVALKLSAKSKVEFEGESEEEDIEDIKSNDIGLVIGAGVELGALIVEGRYTLGLTSIFDESESVGLEDLEISTKNKVISIMVGFSF